MSSPLKSAALLVGLSIALGLAGTANATSLGISQIAKNHEYNGEEYKNHGAIVSEAAKHHGQMSSGTYQGTVQNTVSSLQSVPEPGSLLLLGASLLGLALWQLRWRRYMAV
jgi:hypothetical protein